MNLFTDAMSVLGGSLLPIVAALLLEELTFGGLVRLLIAPWPKPGNVKGLNHTKGDGK